MLKAKSMGSLDSLRNMNANGDILVVSCLVELKACTNGPKECFLSFFWSGLNVPSIRASVKNK